MRKTIIVMGGSFNPPTLAHLRLMQSAIEQTGADRGIFVPSSQGYVGRKMQRAGTPAETLSETLRVEMLRRMCEDDPRLEIDTCEFTRKIRYSYETLTAVRENNPGSELYFLLGGDKVRILPRWHRIDEFLRDFRILITRRDGSDPEAEIETNPRLKAHRDRFVIIDTPDGIEGISSSAVRERLRQGNRDLEDLLHPAVAELLLRNRGTG